MYTIFIIIGNRSVTEWVNRKISNANRRKRITIKYSNDMDDIFIIGTCTQMDL